uniref:Uncharacterized protein n=1 Tax=Eutreptiella gymnastica TaxID=73025 RepID=A0A7S1NVE1_9EUGL|mmetsp:Transcript_95766/g.165061  ORF Transcript_95766/g.165061 Transcript_95766/m.165061 type:complete len:438 (+) Transcript_95766:44-1357(+)
MEASLAVSLMLLGSVAFIFTLIYMLNSPDQHIRSYTWNVVTASIQIFMAIILQDAWTASLKWYMLPADAGPLLVNALYFGLLLSWHSILQVILAATCGVRCRRPQCHRSMVLNLKCWAVTFGVASGGMSKLAWSNLQDSFQDNLAAAALLPLVAFATLCGMFHCFDTLRYWVALSDDGRVDEYEEIWDSYTDKTEDSVLSMAVALVLVKAQHFAMSGTLPLVNGDLRPGTVMPSQAVDLCLTCLVWVPVIVLVDRCVPAHYPVFKRRLTLTAGNCIAFGLINSTTRWVLQECGPDTAGAMLSLPVALLVTALGMFLIYSLDFVADMERHTGSVEANIRQMVVPISTLIGFGWKKAFGDAAKRLVAEVDFFPDPVEHLILALILILWILPGWRAYFLPVIMEQELAKADTVFSKVAGSGEGAATSEKQTEQKALLTAP